MNLANFVGPSNTLSAQTAAIDQTINCYIEPIPPGFSGKNDKWLSPAPGLEIFAATPGNSVDAAFHQDGRAFAVSGDKFIEVFVDGTWTSYGSMATHQDIYPTICSNGTAGHQVFITSGLNGYIFDLNTNTLTLIADVDFPQGAALMGDFMDGYFLVLVYQSRRFQISALLDGTDWDALDVAERSEASDNLMSLKRSHREIWLHGSLTSEIWYDNGDPDFPFAPIQGVFIEEGAASSWTTARFGNTMIWVSIDQDGAGKVSIANGYTPLKISTFAVDLDIQRSGAGLALARAWTYQENGHSFYLLHLPNLDLTWVFDLSQNAWHNRGTWDLINEVWHPNRPISHMYAFGKHLVGDREHGAIYQQSVTFFTQELVT